MFSRLKPLSVTVRGETAGALSSFGSKLERRADDMHVQSVGGRPAHICYSPVNRHLHSFPVESDAADNADIQLKPRPLVLSHDGIRFGCSFDGDKGCGSGFLAFTDSDNGGIEGLFQEPNSPSANPNPYKSEKNHCPLCPAIPKDDVGKLVRLFIAIFGSTQNMFGFGWVSWAGDRWRYKIWYIGGFFAGVSLSGFWPYFWMVNVFLSM